MLVERRESHVGCFFAHEIVVQASRTNCMVACRVLNDLVSYGRGDQDLALLLPGQPYKGPPVVGGTVTELGIQTSDLSDLASWLVRL